MVAVIESLTAALVRLEEVLRARTPRVAKSLRKPATPAATTTLSKALSEGVPELSRWFAWHDGQRGQEALSPESACSLHSIASALKARALLLRARKNVVKDWGCLVAHFAERRRRPPRLRWCEGRAGSREGQEALEDSAALPLHWKKLPRAPTLKQLQGASDSTDYAHRATSLGGWVVLVKIAPDEWLSCFGLSLNDALEEWSDYWRKPPPPQVWLLHDVKRRAFLFVRRQGVEAGRPARGESHQVAVTAASPIIESRRSLRLAKS